MAITRARKHLYCFISRPIESIQPGLLRSYLEYIRNLQPENKKLQVEYYKNPIEKELADLLKQEGYDILPNFESAGFKIDLVVNNKANSIAVFIDGYDYNDYKNGKKLSREVWKQSILERCGWQVVRITAREWHYSKKACVMRICNAFLFDEQSFF